MHTRSEAAAPLNPSEPHEVVNMSRARLIFALAALAALAALSACAEASVDQYTPINPELGGSTDVFGEVVVPPPVMRLTLARVGDRVGATAEANSEFAGVPVFVLLIGAAVVIGAVVVATDDSSESN